MPEKIEDGKKFSRSLFETGVELLTFSPFGKSEVLYNVHLNLCYYGKNELHHLQHFVTRIFFSFRYLLDIFRGVQSSDDIREGG